MIIVDNQFVKDNKRMVQYLISKRTAKHKLTGEEFNDVVTDVFTKCLQNAKYQTDDYALSTFIGLQVRSALADHFGKYDRAKETDPLWGSFELTGEHDHPAEEPENDEDVMDFYRDQLKPFMTVLTETEQRVIINHVWLRLNINDTAEKMSMYASSVSAIKKRAENKLRAAIQGGRRMQMYQEVDIDLPLDSAVKQLPDTQYHAYRLHHFKGWSITRVAAIMGRTMSEVVSFIDDAKQSIATTYGYRI